MCDFPCTKESKQTCSHYYTRINKNSFYFAQFKISKLFKYNEFQNLHCYKKNVSILSDRFKKISNISKPSHFITSKGFKNKAKISWSSLN